MITAAQKRDRELLAAIGLLGLADVRRAPVAWDRLAPPSFRGLLAATAATPATAPAGKFWWDEDKAQFGHGTRGYVPPRAIQTALNSFNRAHAGELQSLALATVEDKAPAQVSTAQWESAMERAIKDAQIVNAAVGRGGVDALTADDIDKASQVVIYQMGRLDRFTNQIEAGEVAKEVAARRAGAYALSALPLYDRMRRRAADVAGYTMERNVLGQAEHCEGYPGQPRPDCPSQTYMGWVKLGNITAIGERLCLWNCKCRIEFGR